MMFLLSLFFVVFGQFEQCRTQKCAAGREFAWSVIFKAKHVPPTRPPDCSQYHKRVCFTKAVDTFQIFVRPGRPVLGIPRGW